MGTGTAGDGVQGVLHQVDDDLVQLAGIAADRQFVREFDSHGRAAATARGRPLHRLAHHLGQIEDLGTARAGKR